MHDGMNGFFGMGFGWFWWLLIIILVGVVVFALLKSSNNRNKNFQGNIEKRESPLEVLEKRYAQGDIGTEEYRQRKKELVG